MLTKEEQKSKWEGGWFRDKVTTKPDMKCIRLLVYINSHSSDRGTHTLWLSLPLSIPLSRSSHAVSSTCQPHFLILRWALKRRIELLHWHSRSCCKGHLPKHADVQVKPWIKRLNIMLVIRFTFSFLDMAFVLRLRHLGNMQRAFPSFRYKSTWTRRKFDGILDRPVGNWTRVTLCVYIKI